MQQPLGASGTEQLLQREPTLTADPSSFMGPELVFVDLSSDDEDPGPRRSGGRDWVDELLDRSVRRRLEGDSDDVVVVEASDVPVSRRRRENGESMGVERRTALEDDDDDACLVLESDPDKPVSVVGDEGRGTDEDMLIVAEKGQVACRDYPHSRHLCATYAFDSSPHEKCCNMCHCYVCDSPAPCSFWGNGKSSIDHCHSNDKEKSWNRLRELFRKRKKVSAQPQKFTDSASVHYSNTVPVGSIAPQPRMATLSNFSAIRQQQIRPSVISQHIQRSGLQQISYQQEMRYQPLYQRVQPIQEEILLPSLTTELMNSHTRSRKTGSMQVGHTNSSFMQVGPTNSSFHSTVSKHNHILRVVPQKDTCVSSEIPHHPQGQQRSQNMLVGSPVLQVDQMQTISSSPSTQLPSQSSLFPLGIVEDACQSSLFSPGIVEDACEKSWQDILASLASELGVQSGTGTGIPNYQQSIVVPSPSLPYAMPPSETCAHPDQSFTNHTVAQTREHHQGEGPQQSIAQMSNSAFPGSNTASGETCLDGMFASGLWY